MSINLNLVTLGGNLTRDPELRRLPSGLAVAEFGLAINDKHKTRDGTVAEQTCFVDIVVWSQAAENASAYLRKGDAIVVEGTLQFDSWQNDKGEKRSKLRVRAWRIHFAGGSRRQAPPIDETKHTGAADAVPVGTAESSGAVPVGVTETPDADMPF